MVWEAKGEGEKARRFCWFWGGKILRQLGLFGTYWDRVVGMETLLALHKDWGFHLSAWVRSVGIGRAAKGEEHISVRGQDRLMDVGDLTWAQVRGV